MKRLYFVLFFIPFLMVRCGTEIGNSRIFSMKATGVNNPALTALINPRALTLPSGVEISKAYVALDQISVVADPSCGATQARQIDLGGPYVADLLTSTVTPKISTTTFTGDHYCQINLKLVKIENSNLPVGITNTHPIFGNTVYIQGISIGGKIYTVQLGESGIDDPFSLVSASGFVVNNTGLNQFFVAFEFNKWFANINLDAEPDSGGQILIDKNHNTTGAYDQIRTNIKLSTRLFNDKNGDGSLENSESDKGSVLAEGN